MLLYNLHASRVTLQSPTPCHTNWVFRQLRKLCTQQSSVHQMESAIKEQLKDAAKVVVWDESGAVLFSNFQASCAAAGARLPRPLPNA